MAESYLYPPLPLLGFQGVPLADARFPKEELSVYGNAQKTGMAPLLGTMCTLYQRQGWCKLAGSALGQRALAGATASQSPCLDSPPHPMDAVRGCYLLPRKPECLLATRVQEAQQAVL